jgi:acyl-CoA synthetase (AMP-forming)/AMP-acid ligase II
MDAIDYRHLDYAPAAFLDSDGLTHELSGAELLDRARVAAAGLTHHGIRFADRVVIVAPTGPDYLSVLVGCLLAGIVPATVAAPAKPADARSAGVAHLRAAVEVLAPAAVVTTDPRLAPAVPDGTVLLTVDDLRRHGRIPRRALRAPEPGQTHHIQLTSGSTSAPKAAVLTHAGVAANLGGLRTAMGLTPGRDRVAMWVPLYHDMGLVLMLAGLTSGVDLDLMTPTTFVRNPLSWLRHMGDRRATVTAAPPFSYRVAADRFAATGAPGLDLSALRHAYVGAEPVPVSVLEHFRDTFTGHGLAEDTLAPCYGMAETVVATTMCTLKHPTTETSFGRVRWHTLHGRRVVSCGTLVGGLSLRITGPGGRPCADGEVGAIAVSGASVMAGYRTADGLLAPPDGWHDTGDLGMALDGELYVVGRTKEMLIVRGRNLPPYDLEAVVEEHPLVRTAAVFSHPGQETEQVVAVVETAAKPEGWAGLRAEVTTSVRQVFGLSLADVVCVPRGGIPRTTSGKRQRQAVRSAYLAAHPC